MEAFLREHLGDRHVLVRSLTGEEQERNALREEFDRKRNKRVEITIDYIRPKIDHADRLLHWENLSEKDLDELGSLIPLWHQSECPAHNPSTRQRCTRSKCWVWLLRPLRYWPSDLLRVFGLGLLYHPVLVDALIRLSGLAKEPRLIQSSNPVEQIGAAVLEQDMWMLSEESREQRRSKLSRKDRISRGWAALSSMQPELQAASLRDETADRETSDMARRELKKILDLMARRSGRSRPKRHTAFRTLLDFERRRSEKVPEKQAVAEMGREQKRSHAAIRSDIERARKALGKRSVREHRRGRFRDREKS